MAGNKTVPLTLGIGGPRIGTATIDENGLVMADIEDADIHKKIFKDDISLSVNFTF